jgi:uncharacterized protein (TIGR02300 family)
MSNRAARGTKRTCQGCGARFYDLNRDPIICPVCGAEYRLTGEAAQAHALRAAEAREREDEAALPAEAEDVEVVPLEEADAEDIADIESDDLDDLDADSNLSGDDEDALMPDDDSDDDDVSGFIGGPLAEDKEDET